MQSNNDDNNMLEKLVETQKALIATAVIFMCVNMAIMIKLLSILGNLDDSSIYQRMVELENEHYLQSKTISANYLDLTTSMNAIKSNMNDNDNYAKQLLWQTSIEERLFSLENKEEEEEVIIKNYIKNNKGNCLNQFNGVYYFGTQKETYYNLDMSRVVSTAHRKGIEGEYWIRDDGVKMLGDYVMIAANHKTHPYGSIVPTSLGDGIVVDTGGFANSNPTQVDIATDW